MEIRIRWLWIWLALAALGLVVAGRAVVRAHKNLVTLNVRNVEVRKVVRSIQWQTWETVLVGRDVQGKVTLNVRNAPLETVLELVAGQVSARSSHLYPIYRDRNSLQELRGLLQRENTNLVVTERWTNLVARGGMGAGGGFRGGLAGPEKAPNSLINLKFEDREPSLAAITLGVVCRAQIVPEDGIDTRLNLVLHDATTQEAIGKFAHALHRNWAHLYALEAFPSGLARGTLDRDSDAARERTGARLDALTPDQRARMEELRNLTPEERQARMQARMEDPVAQQRMIDRTLNNIRMSTPEEMVQRKRQRAQRMSSVQQPEAGHRPF